LRLLLLALPGICSFLDNFAEGKASTVVTTKYGSIRGISYPRHREFLGIPFAAPPVGDLRFMPPRPLHGWGNTSALDATAVKPGCVRDSTWYTLNPITKEDCLYLNIWAPKRPLRKAKLLLPVMVWIYGGGYGTGSGDDLQTRGDRLVATFEDVIVVTLNYRLGSLGFLGSEELREETFRRFGVNSTGNQGLMDMQAALRWVQDCISSFGGDRGNVMIFGESAGASATSALLVSKHSDGLFHKAAMDSGGFAEWAVMNLAHAEHNYRALLRQLHRPMGHYGRHHRHRYWRGHCYPEESPQACLLRVPPQRLFNEADGGATQYESGSDWSGYEQCQWGPTIDGEILDQSPLQGARTNRIHKVPIIIGFNKDDGTEFIDGCPNDETDSGTPSCNLTTRTFNKMYNIFSSFKRANSRKKNGFTNQLYREFLVANFGQRNVGRLLELYPGQTIPASPASPRFADNFWAAETMIGDYIVYCAGRRAATVLSAGPSSSPIFQFYFTRQPNEAPFTLPGADPDSNYITDGFGACHGCEIPFVFLRNESDHFGINGTGEVLLGRAMAQYWTNFAWNSDPSNSTGRHHELSFIPTPTWAPTQATPDASIVLDATESAFAIHMAEPHPRAWRCDAFWDAWYDKHWSPGPHP